MSYLSMFIDRVAHKDDVEMIAMGSHAGLGVAVCAFPGKCHASADSDSTVPVFTR